MANARLKLESESVLFNRVMQLCYYITEKGKENITFRADHYSETVRQNCSLYGSLQMQLNLVLARRKKYL